MRELKEVNGKLDTQSMLEEVFFEKFSKKGGKIPKPVPKAIPDEPTESYQNLNENVEIQIFNVNGAMMFNDEISLSIDNPVRQLDISDFSTGVYLVRFYSSDNDLVKKIVLI